MTDLRCWRAADGLVVTVTLGLMLGTSVATADSMRLMLDANQAADAKAQRLKYVLHCAGCHNEDGSGEPGIVPDMRSEISKFLSVDEGKIYLIQVPGTANSFLSDGEVASLLNWILREFDPEHIPADFEPYMAAEIAKYRKTAISDAQKTRDALIRQMESSGHAAPVPY